MNMNQAIEMDNNIINKLRTYFLGREFEPYLKITSVLDKELVRPKQFRLLENL